MTNDPLTEKLEEMVQEIEEDIVTELAPKPNPQCEICGAKKFETDTLEESAVVEHYQNNCREIHCDGRVTFSLFKVFVGESVPIANRDFQGRGCSNPDCEPSEASLREVAAEEEPVGTDERVFPIRGMVTTAIHEHHINYEPEKTVTVCSRCHSRIHHEEDFHPELTPDETPYEENDG